MMIYFADVNPAGEILAVHGTDLPSEGSPNPAGYELLHKLPGWAGYPKQPAPFLVLRYQAGALIWIDPRTLDQIKADKWTSIKAQRSSREAGTFTAVGHIFNVDPVNLVGAALDAYLAKQNGETYAQAWVLADNTAVALTADQMIAAGRACKAYMAELWVISQTLRGQITAAQDAAAVAAVVWPAGP